MAVPGALYLAFDLAKSPILAGVMRQRPLPGDTLTLIQIAAGSPGALHDAALVSNRSPPSIRAAAIFYIQQVLWADDADCYRVLGVSADASPERLAEHFRWFMKWLHPDSRQGDVKPASAARVLKAWDAIKTPERRRQYDQTRKRPEAGRRRRRGSAAAQSARRIPWIAPMSPERAPIRRWSVVVVAAAVVLAALVFSDRIPSWRDFALRTDGAATSPDAASGLEANDLSHPH